MTEPCDITFIDADKPGYPRYLDTILAWSRPVSASRLLRAGGLDDVLRRDLVVHSEPETPNGVDSNGSVMATHGRLEAPLLPLFDGLGLARLVDYIAQAALCICPFTHFCYQLLLSVVGSQCVDCSGPLLCTMLV